MIGKRGTTLTLKSGMEKVEGEKVVTQQTCGMGIITLIDILEYA